MSTSLDRKTLTGTVVSSGMDKSVVVSIETLKKHPLYGKYMKRSIRYMAHDEKNECGNDDKVEIEECRPLSKRKNWLVKRILEKAK